MDDDEGAVGYCKPPPKHRFKKGVSGNAKGRPPKPKPDNDLRSILKRVSNEEIEVGGQTMTLFEIELRALQRKAAKGDVAASRHLAKLRAEAGVDQPSSSGSGVLLLPSPVPLDEWCAAAALQQAQFREKRDDDGRD